MNCVETANLTHVFSSGETAVNELNLSVEEGSIYGFLGPNGAGKTTTLKLLLGLLKKQRGEISIFGESIEADRVGILKRVGSIIESPSIYGHLTAVENLRVLQKIYQCPKQRIEEVLDLVDLRTTGSKKARNFSLGMKQRLATAIALLHSPRLLILDEPTNGLDPNGILEMRKLLRKLAHLEGITILISSHILAEIEKLVTHVGIINRGNMVFQGTLESLVEQQERSSYLRFSTSNDHRAAELLKSHKIEPIPNEKGLAIPLVEKETVARINEQLVINKIDVYEILKVRSDLESIFFDVINN